MLPAGFCPLTAGFDEALAAAAALLSWVPAATAAPGLVPDAASVPRTALAGAVFSPEVTAVVPLGVFVLVVEPVLPETDPGSPCLLLFVWVPRAE